MAYKKLQLRRGLYKNLPTLAEGELGYCTDTKQLYVGSNSGNVQIMNIDAYVALKEYSDANAEAIEAVDKKIFFAEYESTSFDEIQDAFLNNYVVYCNHETTNIYGEKIVRVYRLMSVMVNDLAYFVSFGKVGDYLGDIRYILCGADGSWIDDENAFQFLPEPQDDYLIPVSNGGGWRGIQKLPDLAEAPITKTITLPTAWKSASNCYMQNVTVSGILATDTPIIDLITKPSTYEADQEAWGKIFKAETNYNDITFYASEALTTKLTLQVKVVREWQRP